MGTFPQKPTSPVDLIVRPGSGLKATRRGASWELALDATSLPGGPGGSGGSDTLIGVAAFAVGEHRALYATDGGLAHASSRDAIQFGRVVGISREAALAGANLSYVDAGSVDDPTWAWSIGPVFLASDGRLTQDFVDAAPAAFLQQVGVAVSPVRIIVGLGTPILIA